MKKQFSLFWVIILFITGLFGQSESPYRLRTGREVAFMGVGLTLTGGGYYLHSRLDPLTVPQVNALRREGLSSFERWVTTQRSVNSHVASNVCLYTSQGLPLVLTMADRRMRDDAYTIGVMYTEVALLNTGLTAVVKNLVRRARPYVYDSDEYVSMQRKTTVGARNSFWSGHTSESAATCFLTARLYADYHPDSKWKPVMWSVAAVIPATTGLLRMTAGKHFPTDVLVGYLTGAAIGYFLPVIHRRQGE